MNLHNQYRERIASGNDLQFGFPSASNMYKLNWDSELAYIAQKQSELCADYQNLFDCNECRRTGKISCFVLEFYI